MSAMESKPWVIITVFKENTKDIIKEHDMEIDVWDWGQTLGNLAMVAC